MKRGLLCGGLLVLWLTGARAVEPYPVTFSNRTTLSPRAITDPTQLLQAYCRTLQQERFLVVARPSLEENFGQWLTLWLHRFSLRLSEGSNADHFASLVSLSLTLMIGAATLGLVYLAFRLFRRRQLNTLRTTTLFANDLPADPADAEADLRQAVQLADWVGAWRATWRRFLARLEQDRLIRIDRTQTNREMVAQLHPDTLPAPSGALLQELVADYDRMIFGAQPLAQGDWSRFATQVDEAALRLHLRPRRREELAAP